MIALYTLGEYSPSVDADESKAIVGENIKNARIAAGFKTQSAFAKHLGVPQPQLSDWENGRYGTPDVTTLLRIAAAAKCSIDALVKNLSADYEKVDRIVISRRDLVRQTAGVKNASDPSSGGNLRGDAHESASLSRLRKKLAALQTAADALASNIKTVTDLIVGDVSGSTATGTHRSDRA